MKGFFNRLLRIDLTQQHFSYEEITDDLLGKTLGGKGLGTHLLLNGNTQNIDPFDRHGSSYGNKNVESIKIRRLHQEPRYRRLW